MEEVDCLKLNEISRSFEQLTLGQIDISNFDENNQKLKELASRAIALLSDTKKETSLINSSKEYNNQVVSIIDSIKNREQHEYTGKKIFYTELLNTLKTERERYNKLLSKLNEIQKKFRMINPDPVMLIKLKDDYLYWKTRFDSANLEFKKLQHEYNIAKQKLFKTQQENLAKIKQNETFYEFLKAAFKIAVVKNKSNKTTIVIAPTEIEGKWSLVDSATLTKESLWRLLAER